jgi:hypothetical protein
MTIAKWFALIAFAVLIGLGSVLHARNFLKCILDAIALVEELVVICPTILA